MMDKETFLSLLEAAKKYTDSKIADIEIDFPEIDLSDYFTKEDTIERYYSKTEIDEKIGESGIIDMSHYYTKIDTDIKLQEINNSMLTIQQVNDAIAADNANEQKWKPSGTTDPIITGLEQQYTWLYKNTNTNWVRQRVAGSTSSWTNYYQDTDFVDELELLTAINNHNANNIAHNDIRTSLSTLDGNTVKLTGDQIINDAKTFIKAVIVGTPTFENHATTKKYVDTELEKKINKTDESNKIYGTNDNGEQILIDLSSLGGEGTGISDNNKLDKSLEKDKIYGTDENGDQILYEVEIEDELEEPEDTSVTLSQVQELLEQVKEEAKEEALRIQNPIGKIWKSEDPTDPYDILGFGTWQRITDKYLWAINDNEETGNLGGSETVAVNIDYKHTHTQDTHTHNMYNSNSGYSYTGADFITFVRGDTANSSLAVAQYSGTTTTSRASGFVHAQVKPVTTIATNQNSGSQTNSTQVINTEQPKYGIYVWRRIL